MASVRSGQCLILVLEACAVCCTIRIHIADRITAKLACPYLVQTSAGSACSGLVVLRQKVGRWLESVTSVARRGVVPLQE